MYLFGWRKRLALILCAFLFLGSISYLSGTLSQENSYLDDKLKHNYLNKSFFNNSSPLKLFDNVSSFSFSKENKEQIKNIFNSTSSIVRGNILMQIKDVIKTQILKKLSILKPKIKLNKEDLVGNIFYKWVSDNIIWVVVKFKLAFLDSPYNWFYDNFSIIIDK